MFNSKYNITLLDSKWNLIKNDVKITSIPRKGEFIYLIDRYYNVINIVHNINKKYNTIVIIEELNKENDINNKNIKI